MVERQRNIGPGLTDPGRAFDLDQGRCIREMQESLEALWRRVADLERQLPAAVARAVAALMAGGGPGAAGADVRTVRYSPASPGLDHSRHPVGSPLAPQPVGATASAGVAPTWSKSDHVHVGVVWGGTVTALPAIPGTGVKEVYWTSSGGGSGDNQVWRAHAGQSAWTPTQKTTTKSGTP